MMYYVGPTSLPGTRYLVTSTWYLVGPYLGTWYLDLVWYLVPGTQYLVHSWYPVPGTLLVAYLSTSTWYLGNL